MQVVYLFSGLCGWFYPRIIFFQKINQFVNRYSAVNISFYDLFDTAVS